MHQFHRPHEARAIEARARARDLGVRVQVIDPARQYQTRSQSDPTTAYLITRTPVGWACECQGFRFSGCCKHLGQVERRADREGWAFGRIAPLSQIGGER